ncbi:MAG: ABC transporter ATP-binding protein [Deltaproteobacteria bacterium]|nr:ABC transporter ATP-binding protein [Deltaproteobacteria bacterium]MBW1929829.1 ABC transporter ATP-binding protein [Deltaproteobacteria bacterium]MBW2024126.1 ABC transporter ATP-binding protein [Deltaproteobacteria bacterium]MBW2124385.1 ABC transporter ATP-binding protein [Deltaproteobacteria bacterium]
MLKVKNLQKNFGNLRALDNVSLEVEGNSVVGLIGPNGSGKSTLFNVVSGFYEKDRGEIYFKGERIDGLTPDAIAKKGLCRTFQIAKAPEKLTVLENMLLAAEKQVGENPFAALFARRRINPVEKKNVERAIELLEILQLIDLKNEYAGDLSGGQKKLLSLGRIFMRNPDMILLDEPTAGVNPTLTMQLIKVIRELQKKEHKSVLIIEHSMKVISSICDKVFVLNFGQVIAEGTPDEIQQNDKVLDAYLGCA